MHKLKLLGIPFTFGQPHTGVALAPQALRQHGLCQLLSEHVLLEDLGDLDFSLCHRSSYSGKIKQERSAATASELITLCVERESLANSFLLSVGGDHGLGLGVVHGLLQHDPDRVVIWADSHGDINPPVASLTGNFHGMPLAFLLGLAHRYHFSWIKRHLLPEKLILLGPRDLDPMEKRLIRDLGIEYLSSSQLTSDAATNLLHESLKRVDPSSNCSLHLSFDLDLFDSSDIFSTGCRVSDGPSKKIIFDLVESLARTGRLKSMDVVELNPELGSPREQNQSIQLALDLILATVSNLPMVHESGLEMS